MEALYKMEKRPEEEITEIQKIIMEIKSEM
jgi:hypothetical protein